MPQMKAVQVSSAGKEFELVQRDIPQPGPGMVRIKVEACGICHSDSFVKGGLWPGIQYPRVPGHEVAGRINEIGSNVTTWKKGQGVGVGWHGGHCGHCESCRRGDFIMCQFEKITGISYDGGYAEYLLAPIEALALMPEGLPAEAAAPMLCAGITTFNSLRNSGARAGDIVAIQGIGGLGHLGIQFANKLGFTVVAVGRGNEKESLAMKLGATYFVDSASSNPGEKLTKMGGARVILSTAPDSKSISSMVAGLSINGKLLIVAAPPDPITVNPIQLIAGRRSIQGWPSGTAKDSEDTMNFATLSRIRPMIETFPLDRAAEAYERMMSGKVRFRAVLTMSA